MSEILYYNPVFITVVLVFMATLLFFYILKERQDRKIHSQIKLDFKSLENDDKNSVLKIIILCLATLLLICTLFSADKLKIIGNALGILLMAKYCFMIISRLFLGIDSVHKEIGDNKNKNLSYLGKAKLLFTFIGTEWILVSLRDRFCAYLDNNRSLSGLKDFCIVLIVAVWYYYLAFQLLCLIGMTIEALSIIITKELNIQVFSFQKKRCQEDFDNTVLLRMCVARIKGMKWFPIRCICYSVLVPLVFVFSVIFCSFAFFIDVIKELIEYTIIVIGYIIKIMKYISTKAKDLGDKQYVWFCMRFSVIVSLVVLVIIFSNYQIIKESSLKVFMFVAESIVVPLIISELFRAKEVFGDYLIHQ